MELFRLKLTCLTIINQAQSVIQQLLTLLLFCVQGSSDSIFVLKIISLEIQKTNMIRKVRITENEHDPESQDDTKASRRIPTQSHSNSLRGYHEHELR